jgi:uncharacterized protein
MQMAMKVAPILVALAAAGCSADREVSQACLRPTRERLFVPADAGLAADDVRFAAADGVRLHGWLVHGGGSLGTAILCHDGELGAGAFLDWAKPIAAAGLDVLVFDYRGFGESEGRASVDAITDDGRAAFEFLERERRVPSDRIALVGLGIGAVPATAIASSNRVSALVLVDAFSLEARVRREVGGFAGLLARWSSLPDGADALAAAPHLQCPVLVVHGEADAAPVPTSVVEAVPHDDKQLRVVTAAGGPPEVLAANARETGAAIARFLQAAASGAEPQPLRTSWTYERGEVVVTILGPLVLPHAPIEAIVVYGRSGLLRVRGWLDKGTFEFRRPERDGVVGVQPCVYAHVVDHGDAWDEDRDPTSAAYVQWRDARGKIASLLADGRREEARSRLEAGFAGAPREAAAWWGIAAFDVARAFDDAGDAPGAVALYELCAASAPEPSKPFVWIDGGALACGVPASFGDAALRGGDLARAQGDTVRAAALYRKGVEISPDGPRRSELEGRLLALAGR